MTTTPQHPDPATHRRAMVAEAGAAAEAAHRRAMEAFDQAQALRIERSDLIRAAGGPLTLDPLPAELLEELRALDARIAQLERAEQEAGAEYRAAEQRHYRAIEAMGWDAGEG